MKIGFDLRVITSKPIIGGKPTGVEEYAVRLLKNLVTIDRKNDYILFSNSLRAPDLSVVKDLLKQTNVKLQISRIPNKIFDKTARIINWPMIDKLLGGVDIYFTPHISITPLRRGCRYILTVPDLSFLHFKHFLPLRKRYYHWSQHIKKACQRADSIIVVSKNSKNDLINFFDIAEKKIKVIYPGINYPAAERERLSQEESLNFSEHITIRKKYNLPKKFIFSLSTLEPRKNIENLILAFEKNCQSSDSHSQMYDLVIAGRKGWYYKRLLKLISKSKVKDRIHYIGFVDEADKPAFYKLAKVFIYPSVYEGFGFPPLEAQASGTPVIVGANSSLTEILGSSVMVVDVWNVNEIFRSMTNILKDRKMRENFVYKGLDNVKKFNWTICAKETLKLFEVTYKANLDF